MDEVIMYELVWSVTDSVLLLTIQGDYTLQDAREVNQQIIDYLDEDDVPISLLIDAADMSRPHNFTEIRAAQSFMNHLYLKSINIVTQDRLVKLSMMVIFNMGGAVFRIYDDMDKAQHMLKYQS